MRSMRGAHEEQRNSPWTTHESMRPAQWYTPPCIEREYRPTIPRRESNLRCCWIWPAIVAVYRVDMEGCICWGNIYSSLILRRAESNRHKSIYAVGNGPRVKVMATRLTQVFRPAAEQCSDDSANVLWHFLWATSLRKILRHQHAPSVTFLRSDFRQWHWKMAHHGLVKYRFSGLDVRCHLRRCASSSIFLFLKKEDASYCKNSENCFAVPGVGE